MEAIADLDEANDVALLNAVEALIGAAASSTSKRRKHYTFKQKKEILRATEGMSEREAARTQEEGGHHQENHPSVGTLRVGHVTQRRHLRLVIANQPLPAYTMNPANNGGSSASKTGSAAAGTRTNDAKSAATTRAIPRASLEFI
ncbi:hypothetical protein L914_12988 [Phytophthora nicotianae]|uniref:Uncharacterized protein n=1 Tax=Phytophthora nicotianae TaxID=4792 RepID=W2MXX8_PHYNI|nr:hypothetical protein L914_12988 [Phytophthora nicotianae]